MPPAIRPLAATERDLAAFLAHAERHRASNGRADTGLVSPTPPGAPFDRAASGARAVAAWRAPVGRPGWQRVWALWDGPAIVGDVDLHARGEPSTGHRAILTIGIEAPFRGQGFGTALATAALAWAAATPSLAWVDLYHFADNAAAAALYRKLGFVEVGRVDDMFRVAGRSMADVMMTKRLRA